MLTYDYLPPVIGLAVAAVGFLYVRLRYGGKPKESPPPTAHVVVVVGAQSSSTPDYIKDAKQPHAVH